MKNILNKTYRRKWHVDPTMPNDSALNREAKNHFVPLAWLQSKCLLIFVLMMAFSIPNMQAQSNNCVDPMSTFTVTNTGQATTSGGNTYTTVFAVVNASTNNILSSYLTTTITAPATAGSYKVYAINYQTSGGATAPTLTTGTNINAIGGTCVAVSLNPVYFSVCDCTPAGSSVTFANTGNNTSTGYTTMYVMTNAAGIIQLSSASSPMAAPINPGEYAIYAVNYKSGLTDPNLTVGTNINAIGGTCAAASLNPVYFKVCPSLSGNVFNDVNGLSDNTVNGTGIGNPSSTTLYANLINNTVVATMPVNNNGTYSFTDLSPATYSVQISTVQGTVGNAAPATSLPTNWVHTGENLGTAAGDDGTVNGILPSVTVSTSNVTDANFGIEQLPTPASLTAASQPNPGGTVSVPVPPATFGATDPDGGTVTGITITGFPTNATSITINGTPYTSGTFPVNGVNVPTTPTGEPTQVILIDPVNGAVVAVIPYSATDNAGKTSPATGVANVPFGTVSLSGNVFNDVNGLSDNTVNGTGLGNPSSTTLYANLLNGSNSVVATTTVNTNGTYTFAEAAPATYSVQISTVQGTVGNAMPATGLPTNWVYTGENLGTAAGDDGTVNGILPSVTVSTSNVTDANFGIEQLPTPASLTAASQPNPGGTVSVPVPPATFGATDPDGGTVTGITITGFPTNATSITINGTPYTSGTFPVNGVNVPTTPTGEPTQVILIDPVNGAVVAVIPYSATDNAGKTSPATGVANVPFGTVSLSGNVFNDVNGLSDNTVNGTGLGNPSSTTLYANLLNGSNSVVATTTVNTNGTYTFAEAAPATYSVQISTVQGTVGNAMPATGLPINWVYTGENLGTAAGDDGTVNGILPSVTVSTSNVTDANFGIEQLPTPASLTAASQPNPGGTVSVPVPPATFGATDPDGGTVTGITITGFPTNATSITINGTPYTSGTFPVNGVNVPTTPTGEPTQVILIDPVNGAVVAVIPYSATDNAGKTSPATGVANVPFGTVSLSGNVFNDVNGLSDNTVNGTGLGNPSSTTLYANLLNGSNSVVATTTVNTNGTYTFAEAAPATYSVQISTVQGTVGNAAPATGLPTNWVHTGENLGTAAGDDGTVNGILPSVTVSTSNVTDANFGIEQLPTPASLTAASQPNPGGTVSVPVPPATFGATDPDGGTVTGITITGFPTNATSITINGTPYTSGTFPVNGVNVPTTPTGEPTQVILIDPVNGAVVAVIPYSATDNAGKTSPATGVANVPFGTVSLSGNVFNDVNGLSDNTVNGTGLGNPSSTTLYANLLNGSNSVVATTTVNTNGTYTFAEAAPATYSVQISTVQGTVGNTAPATSLPTNWVHTGENLGTAAGDDGTVNGILPSVTVSTSNVTDANFGIEQLPTPASLTAASQPNPGGTVSVPVPPATFGATDPDGGTVTGITITGFPTNATSITINGTPYTSGTFPVNGVNIPTTPTGEPTQVILIDPVNGAVVAVIPYSATDNAGKTSPATGVANVPFGTVSLSGNVFNDVNGLSDNTVNGTGLGNPSSTTLYANLLNGSNSVVATTTVNTNGTYTFAEAAPATYSVQISTVQGTVGNAMPATGLPTNWVYTGENLGTAAGDDGTVNGILPSVTVSTSNVTDANFGIEQLPTPASLTAASQPNPGGTVSVPVPPATFGATDPDGGTVTGITITGFPTNATSITINGTPYTSGTFPVNGVNVPTTPTGEPTQVILIDPVNGAVVAVIPYSATDNAGKTSPATGVANVPFGTVSLSGNVFNDVNGLSDNTVNGTGLGNPSSTTLYANLLNGSNSVVATTTVNTNGTFTFPEAAPATYSVQISTVQGTVGNAAPATSLPTNWVHTGENLGTAAGDDGTVNGILPSVTVSTSNVTDANFGIEQLPTPASLTAASQPNPGGTVSVPVPPATFGATDPDGGTVTGITITGFPTNATSITINGTPYTSGTFPVNGVNVPTTPTGEPTQVILIDPVNGAVVAVIPYSATDNAGKTSPATGVANVPFGTVSLSGNVFNDVNGLSDNTVNGTGLGNPSSTTLYANLLNGSNSVVATTTVNTNGTYTFAEAAPATYSVQISTVQGTVGNAMPATSLPTNWVYTGENLGTAAGDDGTVNGILPSVTVSTSNVTDANFGIEQLPTPASLTAASQPNPGGTVSVPVPPATFGATDPDGGTVTGITITGFPTNATSITINGTPYTSGTFPVNGVNVPTTPTGEPTQVILIDPVNGAVVAVIPYSATDNAGKTSPATGVANVPFGTVSLSGNVFNDVNGLSDNTVNGTGLGNPSSTTLYANLLNGSNSVVATTTVNTNGTYTFAEAAPATYSVQISTVQGTVGNAAPATGLPTNWVHTGENLGTAAGDDGTVNGILPSVTVSTSNVTDANFGIEQLPTPASLTAASQPNPGGTVSVPVPPATFGATDPDGGTVTGITITGFPTNATSITINGTPYTSGTFPVNGVNVPTTPTGEPTQVILIDPVNGAVVAVIPYSATDNAGKTSPATGVANVPFGTVSLSGNVFNDVNGLSDNTVNGTGLGNPSSTTLYANLLNGSNSVVATTTVNTNGTYTFAEAAPATYSVQISTVQGTVGNTAPATSLPTNWVHTGENLGTAAGDDGTVNGILPSVTVSTSNVTDANFGIEQLPTPASLTAASQPNPGGTVSVPVPPATFGATDPDGGTVTGITITGFPTNATSITINGTPYTSGTFPVNGVNVPTTPTGEPTQVILIDPVNGAVVAVIPYSATDNAGKTSPATGVANVPFGTVSLSGNVFNDVNGLSDNTVNGTGLGNPSSTTLYANLLNGSNSVVATTTVNTNGTFTFPEAAPATYSVQISTVQGTVGNAMPATGLPTNWVHTGENLGTAAGNDGTVNSILTGVTVSATNVTNANFGIEQLPTPASLTAASQPNPGSTVSVTVPPTTFASTDPDGGTVTGIKITALPTNATSITVDGVLYTTGFPITVPTTATGGPTQTISVDPIEGAVIVSIPYKAIDNAGKESAMEGFAKVPFTLPNPDVNATYVNVSLTGDVSTNDPLMPGSTYGNPPINPSNPGTAMPVINLDGTYTFISPIRGTFTFQVPVTSQGGGVTPVQLLIVVIDLATNTNPPIAHTDLATTLEATPVTLGTLLNDACGNAGCNLNPASVTVLDPPNHGTISVNPLNGSTTYTPQVGFTGADTLTYQVADNMVPPNVAEALQIITVIPSNAPNTTSATDDYRTTTFNTPALGNVVVNDIDPQNHQQTVTPQTTTIPGVGTLILTTTGTYTFTPVNGYVGPVEFPYTVCDNGSPIACAEATLHILTASGLVFPVVLSEFNVDAMNCDVLVTWRTEQEENSSHFNVMRKRSNEKDFQQIAQVQASGNSSTPRNYSYTDKETGTGTYYYYLQNVDIDQKSTVSETKMIQLSCGASVSIYPNPATDKIHIQMNPGADNRKDAFFEIRMTDMTGRTIHYEKVAMDGGMQQVSITCSHLAAGQYHVSVLTASDIQTVNVQVTK